MSVSTTSNFLALIFSVRGTSKHFVTVVEKKKKIFLCPFCYCIRFLVHSFRVVVPGRLLRKECDFSALEISTKIKIVGCPLFFFQCMALLEKKKVSEHPNKNILLFFWFFLFNSIQWVSYSANEISFFL